jgi:hypothetical protein
LLSTFDLNFDLRRYAGVRLLAQGLMGVNAGLVLETLDLSGRAWWMLPATSSARL